MRSLHDDGHATVLLAVDPVACGRPAFERALAGLNPNDHDVALAVIAKDVPAGLAHEYTAGADSADSVAHRHADAHLSDYLHTAAASGFAATGWVAPARRAQFKREVTARAPYNYALAVSPSRPRNALTRTDAARVLRATGIPTAQRCT